jgi:phosphosulfolactate phosphohydrolase-like enzyme
MKDTFEGCVVALMGAVVVGAFLLMGGAAVSRSIADWRHAGAIVQVAEQETEQTQIEWAARTEIARIEADATKKTSFAFVAFYLVRYGVWVASALWVVAGALWLWGRGQR